MEKEKKHSAWLTALKVILIVIGSIAAILVGSYLFIKYYLGFDLIKIKNAIDLLNKDFSSTTLISQPYSDEDISSAFYKMYSDNSIYTETDGNYTFNKQELEESTLQSTAHLNNKELAGIFNLYIVNYQEDLDISKGFQLKQIIFSNLVENAENVSVDIEFVFEINLANALKTDETISSLMSQYIPKKVIITSNSTLTYPKNHLSNYTFSNKDFKINNLSNNETNTVLDVFKMLKIVNETNEILTSANNMFFASLLGDEESDGFLSKFTDIDQCGFIENDGAILLEIKKV